MHSASMLPDRPVSTRDEDSLGRADLAENLASLIANAPVGSTLRLGVYGGWGEGKTSVLHMMRTVLHSHGHTCIWIVPWLADSKEEIATQITQELARELKIDLTKLQSSEKAAKRVATARKVADADIRTKALDAVLGPALENIFGNRVDRAEQALTSEITKKLRDKKLIVFIDDLDRVRPDLVPGLLLTLREALDRPDFYYVLALAPEIVERGLTTIHAGWGEPRQFLEKIVELAWHLPQISESDRGQYIEGLAAAAGAAIDTSAMQDILSHLPANPRRIKLFIRYIASLSGHLRRFGPNELNLRLFYLAQLLKMEFPNEVRSLLQDPSVLKKIQYRGLNRYVSDRQRSTSGNENENRPEEEYIDSDHPDRNRFLQLCEAIAQRGSLEWGGYELKDLLQIPEVMPLVTRQEAVTLSNDWLNATDPAGQTAVLETALFQTGTRGVDATRALWVKLLEVRDGHLGGVIEREFESEMVEGLEEGAKLLGLLQEFADGRCGFTTDVLQLEQWRELRGHVSKWAHFTRHPTHEKLRASESELLEHTFGMLAPSEKARLVSAFSPERLVDPVPGPAFIEVASRIQAAAQESAIEVAVSRFEMPDGLDIAWGDGKDEIVRTILLDPDSPLYTNAAYYERLREVAARAANDSAVQQNFLTFFRQLAYGAQNGGTFSMRDCERLLAQNDFLNVIWSAAVIRPLNPRVAGTLRRFRAFIGSHYASLDAMPLPVWWQRLEETGF